MERLVSLAVLSLDSHLFLGDIISVDVANNSDNHNFTRCFSVKFIFLFTIAFIYSNVLFMQSSKADITFEVVQKYSKADTARYQKGCRAETKKMLLQTPDSKGKISASETFLDDCYRALESRQNGKGKVSQCISNFRAYARFYYRSTIHSKK